jgi:CO/xanthine dehydrogenase Mo-binding subunit
MPTSSNPSDARAGSQIGRSVQRLESRDKVTGRAQYTHLMRLPGMLHAKLFRSTVAHGRIKSVDLSVAKRATESSM